MPKILRNPLDFLLTVHTVLFVFLSLIAVYFALVAHMAENMINKFAFC